MMRLGRFAILTLGVAIGALLVAHWMRSRDIRLFPVSSMQHGYDDHTIDWIPLN